jgi:deoxyadenosine/deoxycytidine kinase
MRILLIGNIASGKSTLAKKLGRRFGLPVFKEDVDKSRLFEAFSLKRADWSFDFHMAVLNERFANHFLCNLTGGIIDRTIWETMAFANVSRRLGEMTRNEYHHFHERFTRLEKHSAVRSPKIIFLESSPEQCLERMRLRGRQWERKIDLNYLRFLDSEYILIMKKYLRTRKVNTIKTDGRSEDEIFRIVVEYLRKFSN